MISPDLCVWSAQRKQNPAQGIHKPKLSVTLLFAFHYSAQLHHRRQKTTPKPPKIIHCIFCIYFRAEKQTLRMNNQPVCGLRGVFLLFFSIDADNKRFLTSTKRVMLGSLCSSHHTTHRPVMGSHTT